MENPTTPVCFPLKNLQPYVEMTKKYFGLYHPNLSLEMALLDVDPERECCVSEFVTMEKIKEILRPSFSSLIDDKVFLNLLWFIANLYYGKSVENYTQCFDEDIQDDLIWNVIKEDIAKLYSFMADHKIEEPVTISIGKDKVVLDNYDRWFQGLTENQLFPNCIPEITDKAQAEEFYAKKPGRPKTRREVNMIVNGMAKLFSDEGWIEGRAPKSLCSFIKNYLVLMDLIEKDDVFVTEKWIKAQISNLQKPGKDARLDTIECEDVSIEELKVVPQSTRALNWLFHQK